MKAARRWAGAAAVFAGFAGAGLTALLHVVQFGPLGTGWWFGLGAGALEGGLGSWMNRRGLQECGPRGMAWSLGGGLARVALLLIAWRIGVWAGLPEYACGICMVTMYVVMMGSGIAAVARYTGTPVQKLNN